MTRITRTLIRTAAFVTAFCLTILGQTGAALYDAHGAMRGEAPQPSITISGGTEAQHSMAEWAIDRFAEANLPLPDIAIEFHASMEDCGGYLGYYRQSDKQLDVCNQGDGRIEPIHTILHELAHAWSFEYLPVHTVEAFTEDRGLDAWRDADADWWLQGQEQAAEVVAWGLMDDEEPFKNIWVIREQCDQLSAAFKSLTGIDPLHTSTVSCK